LEARALCRWDNRLGASEMSPQRRNYLDNAATSWPKPDAVYTAMDQFAREIGAAAGRGSYQAATAAGDVVAACRLQLMSLVNARDAKDVAFFSNGTTALNAAIFGVVQPGDHVVSSAIEHNSVLRPLQSLSERGIIRLTVIDCDAEGQVDIDQLLDAIEDQTLLVALAHASNVTGAVQNVHAIGQRLANHRALFLCDASQTLGYLPIDKQGMGIDLLASAGHKGSLGPLGTGMLVVSAKAASQLRPTVFGGTGSISESLQMPTRLPEMLEAGNLNVPAIAGWNAGLQYLRSLDTQEAEMQRLALCRRLCEQFADLDGGFAVCGRELPLASLVFDRLDPMMVATLLDSEFSIEVRSGLHCAALVHRPIQERHGQRVGKHSEYQGTLRLSAGHFTQLEQIDAAAAAVHDLVAELSLSQ
jgi:cysteine desulfurase / selenocysteine lyase